MNTTVTRPAFAWIAISSGLAVAQVIVLTQVSQAFQVVDRSVGADSKHAALEAEAPGSEPDLQSIEKAERERRIIVDASKSGGIWWAPQGKVFRSDQPHQGKAVADYLRSRGCKVIELSKRTALENQLKGADMVIRVPNYSPYREAELQAYRDYVATGGSLFLVGNAANPRAAPDALANAFGFEFSNVRSRLRVTRWADDPYLQQLPSMNLTGASRISRSPEEFIPWGWDANNNLIVGSVAYGKGKVVALSRPWFISSHQQALPLTDYILHQLIGLPLNPAGPTGVAQPARPLDRREAQARPPAGQTDVAEAQQSDSRPKNSFLPAPKAILRGHRKTIMSVAYSPDGTTLATASWDGTVRLWSLANARAVATLDAFPKGVNAVAYSRNGKYLAAAGWRDASIKLWSLLSEYKEISRLWGEGTDFGIYDLAISPDGKTLAAACSDKSIKLWNAETQEFETSLPGHTHFVQALAFSPDGRFLASGCFDHGVKLWDARTRREHATLSPGAFDKSIGHQGPVNQVVFSPDSATLVTSSEDRTVKLWDVATGKLRASLETAPARVVALAISPDNSLLATGGDVFGGEVKLWRLATGEELVLIRAHRREVKAIAFSPDGETLATGGLDRNAKLWDVKMILDWGKRRPVVRQQRQRPAKPSVPPSEALEALDSPDFDTRFRAAVTLARSEGGDAKRIASILIEAVEKESLGWQYRYQAIAMLGRMKSEKVLVTPVLIAAMDDSDRRVRLLAAKALTHLGPDARSAVPVLIEKLKSMDNATRAEAARVLASMQKEAAPALPTLLDALVQETYANLARQQQQIHKTDSYRPSDDSDSYDARARILQAIAAINPPIKGSDPRLLPAIGFAETDPHYGVSDGVMRAFRKIYPFPLGAGISDHWLPPDPAERERLAQSAVPVLVKMLDDKDRSLRAAAVKILGDTGAYAKAAVPALKETMKDSDRLASVEAACSLMHVDRNNTISVPFLIDALGESDPEVRERAIDSLLSFGKAAEPAIPSLAEIVLDLDRTFSENAVHALGRAGKKGVLPLIDALQDANPRVRERASRGFFLLVAGRWVLNPQEKLHLVPGIPVFSKALADSQPKVRARSARVLGALGAKAEPAIPSLTVALEDENRYVRWEAAEALHAVAPGVADAAVAEALSDRPSISNAKGDRLTLLSIDPPLPARLESNEPITVRCSFHLQSAPRCYIWVQPYTDGQRSPFGTSGSASYRKGDGEKEGSIYGRAGVKIDQIQISLAYDRSSNKPVVELDVDVNAEWENAGEVHLDRP